MRIPIREQLGLLVVLCSLTAVGVISIATWYQNHNFVVNIRLSGLSLTASLKAAQLSANLLLFQTSVDAISTRIVIQSALQRYNQGNDTDQNWARSIQDLQGALSGGGNSALLLQGIVFPKNDTGSGNPGGLINVTGDGLQDAIPLPVQYPNGSTVYLGDPGLGFPPSLYPNLTHTSERINSTYNQSNAFYEGLPLYSNSTLLLGPYQVNESFAMLSLTVAINNNTSRTDILGWLTIVIDARMIYSIINSPEGVDKTGQILVVAPNTLDNKFPPSFIKYNQFNDAEPPASTGDQRVRFLLPPINNRSTTGIRHPARDYSTGNPALPFAMKDYPAVYKAYEVNDHQINNAGSMLSTHNEENVRVSVGYAVPSSKMVDWALVFEQSHSEVIAPINHLRNILIACVFGTMGAILLVILPIAHYSVRPIRRLREATKKSVEPHVPGSDFGSADRSIDSGVGDEMVQGDEENFSVAKKEGFLGSLTGWRPARRKSRAERHDESRRRTFRIPGKVEDKKHFIHDELTDLTKTFNEMSEELVMQYERLEERVKERTAELELSKKAAEAANESKTLFIANISHELKTPLNGILGMCAVSMGEEDPTKIKRSLGIIYKSGDLLLHLLTDLLTFSKNQIGQQLALDEKEFRLADISSQILSIFEKQANDGQINLRVNFQGPQPALSGSSDSPSDLIYGPYGTGKVRDMCLWGDQHRILQVLINLVSNSLKFTPAGGSVEVRIKCLGEGQGSSPSRKGSTQSRQSKQSRQHSRGTKVKGHAKDESDHSVSSVPSHANGEVPKTIDTTLTINVMGSSKHVPQLTVRDRSSSPPPLNSKTLVFEFDVEDTGPGIPENQQQKVFEPFVQGDLGLSKKYGGTGLGLSICAQLANLMGGSISLVSREGAGSTFSMRIPLRFTKERSESTTSSHQLTSRPNSVVGHEPMDRVNRAPQRHGSDSDLSLKSTPSNGGIEFSTPAKPRLVGLSQPFFATSAPLDSPKKQLEAIVAAEASKMKGNGKVRVLVAEDNKVNQEVVLRMLKLEDIYDVTVAKDGQEALDKVRKSMEDNNLYNLIFMDVQMPNLDGLQSTRLIREMGFNAPIVALTAFAEESNVKECMDSGMNFFLPKPIRRPQLKQVLKKYCATIPEAEEDDAPPGSAATIETDGQGDSPTKSSARRGQFDDPVSPFSGDESGLPGGAL